MSDRLRMSGGAVVGNRLPAQVRRDWLLSSASLLATSIEIRETVAPGVFRMWFRLETGQLSVLEVATSVEAA